MAITMQAGNVGDSALSIITASAVGAIVCLVWRRVGRSEIPWFLKTKEADRVLQIASSYAFITIERLSELTSLADSSTVMIVEALIKHRKLKATFDPETGLIQTM